MQSVTVLLVCLLATVCALDPHQLELKQHYEHLAYIADFPCLKPQPKVIPVHKLFSESQSHGKAYFPDVTVLYRCDECTGSCTAEHKCAAKLTELVLLPFKATYLEPTEKHKVGSWAMEYHELLNHTECGCIPRPPPDSCPPDHMHKRDEVKNSRPEHHSSSGSDHHGSSGSDHHSSSGSDHHSSSGSDHHSSSGSDHHSSSGSDYQGSSGSSSSSGSDYSSKPSSSSNSGDNYVQPDSSSEVNRETTTPDYLSQLFERNGN